MNPDLQPHLHADIDAEHIEQARTVNGRPSSDRMVPYENIAQLLTQRASDAPETTYIIFYPEGGPRVEYTFGAFFELVRRAACVMHGAGIGRGGRICTVGVNHVDTVIQYFAAWYLGAVVVPVNVGEDDKRVAYILKNSRAKLAFVQTSWLKRISDLKEDGMALGTIIEVGPAKGGEYPLFSESLGDADPRFMPPAPAELSDDALIIYTSGTTGLPKGVVLDQYNLLVDAKGIGAWHGIDATARMMCVLPLHHVNGTVVTLLTPMYHGASIVLNQKFHTGEFFKRIADERVHVVSVVPTLLQYLLHDGIDIAQYDLKEFRHIICGAGPLTCELAARFENTFGFPIVHGYGLSETTCYSCYLPADLTADEHRHWLQDFGFPSIGVAIPENEMDIQSHDGKSLPEAERGEIVIRGHTVMKYYYENPDANASTFANGWFRSGDEGFYKSDAEGRKFFFITGRLKELIIRGGVNIAPLEIDEVLNTCPGVKTGISVGFENDWYGEEVGALVQKADPELTQEIVIAHCRKHLPSSKCPKVVVFSDEIPVTSTGKYQRNKVKHLFESFRSQQFH